jgi:hypothetical protein
MEAGVFDSGALIRVRSVAHMRHTCELGLFAAPQFGQVIIVSSGTYNSWVLYGKVIF